MELYDLKLLKEAMLKLRADGPVRPGLGICANLTSMLASTPYLGSNPYLWVASCTYFWPELNGRPVDYPIGDLSLASWDPEDEFGARRLRFLDYLIKCADLQGANDE